MTLRCLYIREVAELRRELQAERELTTKLAKTVTQLQGKMARRERELDQVKVRAPRLPSSVSA